MLYNHKYIQIIIVKGAKSEAVSISSELLMCGGSVHSILLLPLVTRCLEVINVYIYRTYLFLCQL